MDVLTLVLAGVGTGLAVYFFGGVTQPEWGLAAALVGLAGAAY